MGFQRYVPFVFLMMIVVLNFSTCVKATAAELCQKAEYPEVCQSIVKDVSGINLETAIQASIQAAIDQTIQAKAMLHAIKAPQDALGKSNVQDCYENYDDAIDNLKKSAENLKSKSMADLKINLSAAISAYVTCDSGFTDDAGQVDPAAKINQFLGQIVGNSLALASAMTSRDL